ncbi:MAG: hypothetical protein O3A53_09135 [Acidobacteria bacterium]|nr:hypothetical protein [Acidobacteriota bacterium]
MRLKAAVTTLALLLALPSLAEKVDLRGPAPEAGETTVMTVQTETDPGTLNMSVQGQVIQGQMEMDSTNIIEQTILEVTDGSPSKVKSKFVKAKSVTKTTMFGQTNEQEDTNMQGTVMTQTKTADGWSTDVEGNALPQEAKDLIKGAGYVDPRMVFPENPVGVGDKWKVEDEMLQAFMGATGLPGAKFEGEMSFEMVDLKNEDGKLVAVLHFEMDGTITMNLSPTPEANMNMVIKMKGDGSIYRNLTNYTTAQDFEGNMDMTMEMTAGGQKAMDMSAKMPMKVKQSQERK